MHEIIVRLIARIISPNAQNNKTDWDFSHVGLREDK